MNDVACIFFTISEKTIRVYIRASGPETLTSMRRLAIMTISQQMTRKDKGASIDLGMVGVGKKREG